MSKFELALRASIPLISVQTNDLVNLQEVLEEISGKKANLFQPKIKTQLKEEQLWYYYGEDSLADLPELYRSFADKSSSLVIVNPTEVCSVLHEAGELPTPISLVKKFLLTNFKEKKANDLLTALGGLSLKDVKQIIMLAQADTGFLNPTSIMKVRQGYSEKIQGLEIVQINMKGYTPHPDLQIYAQEEKDFFLGEHDSRLRPRGVLATGIPGAGKTSGAKYLAKEWGVPLFRLDVTLQSKWHGESERNLSLVFEKIENNAPCIFLIDEVEKLFSKSNDSGLTQKLLASLLWWMQEHDEKVFTYMTCNLDKNIPPELLRRGRVDMILPFKHLSKKNQTGLAESIAKSYKGIDSSKAKAIAKLVLKDSSKDLTPAEISFLVAKTIKHGK